MKLNGKILLAAMAISAFGAMGCSRLTGEEVAPEENAATAPVEENGSAATPGFEENSRRYYGGRYYYAPYGPPARRFENPGRAPSNRHFWSNGYYRWNGRQHVWYGGSWVQRRDNYQYVGPHWERHYSRWAYVPGHWVRR